MDKTEKYAITGMTCSSCASHIQKAVGKLKGVKQADVNLRTNLRRVTYSSPCDEEKIRKAVSDAGYGASLPSDKARPKTTEDKETTHLFYRMVFSFLFLIPLFYISRAYRFNREYERVVWPLGTFGDSPFLIGRTTRCLALMIRLINKEFYFSGVKSLLHLSPNRDTLVSLGSGVAFLYSFILYFVRLGLIGGSDSSMRIRRLSRNLSFETAGRVPALITIGKFLEAYSKGKTTNAIRSLLNRAPKKACLVVDGKEKTISADELKAGDVFLVRPGETFPADGVVLDGVSSVNESYLTGESIPVDKQTGSPVSCATINENGTLKCKATKVGSETRLHQIVDRVEQASGTKTKLSRRADKVSLVFVPAVILVSLLVFAGWRIFGKDFVSSAFDGSVTLLSYSIERAISVLVVSCPCALGLATPVAIRAGNGRAAKMGILFKTAQARENTGKIKFALFDKTGTITKGTPEVSQVILAKGIDRNFFLSLACSLEKNSSHPLSKPVVEYGKGAPLLPIESFSTLPGKGVRGIINGKEVLGLSRKARKEEGIRDREREAVGETMTNEGRTLLCFSYDRKIIGFIGIKDAIKEEAKKAIASLKHRGIAPLRLTGDNKQAAKAVAKEVGIDTYFAERLPQDKHAVIERLKKRGRVARIGDGINDAPALAAADVSLAVKSGSDIARESSDVVLRKSSLRDVVKAVRRSQKTSRNIKENLFWAFLYNVIRIPFAAGVFSALGLSEVKPWRRASAMALSSVTVCLNALRLNLVSLSRLGKKKEPLPVLDGKVKDGKEGLSHKQRLIPDRRCQHCVTKITDALSSLPGVYHVSVSLETKEAECDVKDLSDSTLLDAVRKAGYSPKMIQKLEEKKMNQNEKQVAVVKGRRCHGCERAVEGSLKKLSGVLSVKADHSKEEVIIESEKGVSSSDVKKAVEDAGYQFVSLK